MARLDDLRIEGIPPRPRRKRRSPWGALVWLALLIGGGWVLVRNYAPDLARRVALPRPAVAVKVLTIPEALSGPAGSISAGGYLEVIPPGPVLASSLIAGKLSSIGVVEGDRVHSGQIIARLDAGTYTQQAAVAASRVTLARAELKRQQAGFRTEEIAAANASMQETQARLTQAQADYGRAQQLFTAGVVARSQLDQAQSQLDQARSAVQARQAQLSMLQAGTRREDLAIYQAALGTAEAELAQAQYSVAQCAIHAPVGGVVYQQLAQPGDWLAPDSGERAAGGVLSIFDPRQIQAWCDVNQRDSARISLGQHVLLSTDGQPQRQIEGVVQAVMPRANLQKNTLQVKIRISDPPPDLRPELAVKITFRPSDAAAQAQPAGIVVPASALVTREGQSAVYVVAAGKAQWRLVEPEILASGEAIVHSGLSPGEQVILNPNGLADGQSVKPEAEAKP